MPFTRLGARGGAFRRDRAGQDPQRGPQRAFRDHREDGGVLPLLPGRLTSHSRTSRACPPRWAPAGSRIRGRGPAGRARSRQSPVRLERHDLDGDVIQPQGIVIERFPVHVHDEGVSHRRRCPRWPPSACRSCRWQRAPGDRRAGRRSPPLMRPPPAAPQAAPACANCRTTLEGAAVHNKPICSDRPGALAGHACRAGRQAGGGSVSAGS